MVDRSLDAQMPVPTETFWNTKKASVVFACSSIALLASIIWMVKVDYARPWRDIQNNFTDLQASLAHFDVLATQTPESLEEMKNAQAAVEDAKKKIDIPFKLILLPAGADNVGISFIFYTAANVALSVKMSWRRKCDDT